MVYIKVSKGKEAFGMHKDFLCSQSPYFRGAFDGGFEEATAGEPTLETTDPIVSGLLVE